MFKHHIFSSTFKMERKHVLFIMLSSSISTQEHDEPILKHLQDIKVIFSGPDQPMVSTIYEGFKVLFIYFFKVNSVN